MGLLLSLPVIVIVQSAMIFSLFVTCKRGGFSKKASEKQPPHPSKKELKSEKVPSERLKMSSNNKKDTGNRTVDETQNITEDPDLVSRDDYGVTEQTTMATKGDSNSRSAKVAKPQQQSSAPIASSPTKPAKKK